MKSTEWRTMLSYISGVVAGTVSQTMRTAIIPENHTLLPVKPSTSSQCSGSNQCRRKVMGMFFFVSCVPLVRFTRPWLAIRDLRGAGWLRHVRSHKSALLSRAHWPSARGNVSVQKRSLHEMKVDSFIVLAFLSIAPSRWFKVFLACLVLN